MERLDCIVIGAGVIGLAIARELAIAGREVVIVEAESRIGAGISSRNSEVIHAGIYYATGLHKTRLCVEGRQRLYKFCNEYHVPHKRCGKLLVASQATEISKLDSIAAQAKANGVNDLRFLTGAEARALEPEVIAQKALLSPSTGIIDAHAYMLALLGDAESHGAVLSLETPITGGQANDSGVLVEAGGAAPISLQANLVINAAGLGAQAVARSIVGMPADRVPPLCMAKGNYFNLAMTSPFSRLIYPMPQVGGLGVHLTLDMGGQARFGPDVEWVDEVDFAVDPRRADAFYAAIRNYWPGLPDGALQPAYSGIRPKIERSGGPTADFVIQGRNAHGVEGLVNLFGIESPGLTASLAIAAEVASIV